jgi:glycyl-tRNA synthetase
MDLMDKLSALCKRRGIIFQGSEIYGGLQGFWDYGPLGVELKNNIKKEWWKDMVYAREDVVGIDAAIIMNPEVWRASGHLDAFTDPLVECRVCHKRFRADQIKGVEEKRTNDGNVYYKMGDHTRCPSGEDHDLDVGGLEFEPKKFNLMTEVYLGVTEPKQKAYLRGEITQGVFVNFLNVVNSTRVKVPFGIAQIGKAFRNEITPGNFTFRSREFEQMELEYFVRPDNKKAEEMFEYWKKERINWYVRLGIKRKNLRFRDHRPDEKAHYARYATDIEYNSPFGWKEFEGIHHRGDWDLGRHKLLYKDPDTNEEYTPWVIETSGGVDRATLFFLLDAYYEDDERVVLKLHPKLSPYKVAVFPLLANKEELVEKAREIYQRLSARFYVYWDERGNIGKRYFSQDEIGTPWCVTVDFQTLEDLTVTVRDRDTKAQQRISVDSLEGYFSDNIEKYATE